MLDAADAMDTYYDVREALIERVTALPETAFTDPADYRAIRELIDTMIALATIADGDG
jgi:hypothetical protein